MPGCARFGKKDADLDGTTRRSRIGAKALATETIVKRLDVGHDCGTSGLVGVGCIHALKFVLRIGPRESALRRDRQPVVAEASEIEWFSDTGWLPAQQ